MSVWWDIGDCEVLRGCNTHAITQIINAALMKMSYHGPVTLSAYGDTNGIPSSIQRFLSSTGIGLNHILDEVKDARDKKILVDMLFWAVDNPARANYLLTSGDKDFSNAIHQLWMSRYNILLAQPFKASPALAAAATNLRQWTSLVAGGSPQELAFGRDDLCGSMNKADVHPEFFLLPSPSGLRGFGNVRIHLVAILISSRCNLECDWEISLFNCWMFSNRKHLNADKQSVLHGSWFLMILRVFLMFCLPRNGSDIMELRILKEAQSHIRRYAQCQPDDSV